VAKLHFARPDLGRPLIETVQTRNMRLGLVDPVESAREISLALLLDEATYFR
jgi:hypothetical protein